jgi:WD40 repeat protein
MTQHKPPQAVTLFDLIARTWQLGTGVHSLAFNAKGTSLSAVLAEGRLGFVSVKDAESPDSRVRVEADTGRASIRPRSKPLPPPVLCEAQMAAMEVAPCRLGEQGMAFAHAETGLLWRATARGQLVAMNAAPRDEVTALAALPRAGLVAAAFGERLRLLSEDGGAEVRLVDLPHEVSRIAVSADESLLACWGPGQMSLIVAADLALQQTIACPGELLDLQVSPCRRWLVGGCCDKALLLVDLHAGTTGSITDFPAPVHSLGFSAAAKALVASGAFRVVGWSLPDLPFDNHEGTPLETGKPGLTLVDRVAVHPSRDLCAVGYATGLVMLCHIGHGDEMLVREGNGSAITALNWSDDGAHLGIGGDDGSLSIATFPKNMFK